MKPVRRLLLVFVLIGLGPSLSTAQTSTSDTSTASEGYLPLQIFYSLFETPLMAEDAIQKIEADWKNAYAAMALEIIHFLPSRDIRERIVALLEKASGLRYSGDIDPFYQWLWSIDPGVHPDYAEFKAMVYENADWRFREYFTGRPKSTIRLDEIRWGGVRRDGIPPLDHPTMVSATEQAYLDEDNIVFGVEISGEARAYPKRILAWHEIVKDRISGREVIAVYCTLCGTVILYDTIVNGVHHELGTSGFLYRSNKLMYDHATKSLWSTFTGSPVVGRLVGKRIVLNKLNVVTTTWGEWKRRHPRTLVLSLETGFQRDYSEGVAYRDYFATDRPMFPVPRLDRRLPNKAEVLALRYGGETLAISADFLLRNRLHYNRTGNLDFVVLTDTSGANRVYQAIPNQFARWDGSKTLTDRSGVSWKVTESKLVGPNGQTQKRLPAHRSFWFGWFAQFPKTRLVK